MSRGTWNFLPYMEEIGRAYAEAADDSSNPQAVAAWKALSDDSVARANNLDQQYNIKTVQFEPYENAEQQDYDIRNYNNFLVSDQNSEHPLWTVEENVAFRKVHDLMGHYPTSGDFSWEGENLACGEHFNFLSGPARIALFVECIMQTAAVNVYRRFLPQKIFIPKNFDPVEGYIPEGEAQAYSDQGKIYWNKGGRLQWKLKGSADEYVWHREKIRKLVTDNDLFVLNDINLNAIRWDFQMVQLWVNLLTQSSELFDTETNRIIAQYAEPINQLANEYEEATTAGHNIWSDSDLENEEFYALEERATEIGAMLIDNVSDFITDLQHSLEVDEGPVEREERPQESAEDIRNKYDVGERDDEGRLKWTTSSFKYSNPKWVESLAKQMGWTLERKTKNNHRVFSWIDPSGNKHIVTAGSGNHGSGVAQNDLKHFTKDINRCMSGTCAHVFSNKKAASAAEEWTPEERKIKLAAWADVAQKAKRIKDEGGVRLIRNGVTDIVAEVMGDTDVYQVEISRLDPNSMAITGWSCQCEWYDYAFQRTRKWKKYEGRPCSHTMAAFWTSLSSPLDDEENLQDVSPLDGVPPTGQSPGVPDLTAPPVTEPVQSVITAEDPVPGTISIPGTFSKLMRKALDDVIG